MHGCLAEAQREREKERRKAERETEAEPLTVVTRGDVRKSLQFQARRHVFSIVLFESNILQKAP